MQPDLIQSMHDQVRAIYRAVTGQDPKDVEQGGGAGGGESVELVMRRFVELEAMARAFPVLNTRVPPFTFTPRVDVIGGDDEVVIEVELPGLSHDEIAIDRQAGALSISGVRRDVRAARGHTFHAEIPRGPFTRVIPLPVPVEEDPRVELDRGVLRIHLKIATSSTGREPITNQEGNTTR
jgi:HSP20 family molecular chaperone IbpA